MQINAYQTYQTQNIRVRWLNKLKHGAEAIILIILAALGFAVNH